MNLIVIAIIVLAIVLISREPKTDRKRCRTRRREGEPDRRRIEDLSHRVGVLEEILLDRERRLRDKFGDL